MVQTIVERLASVGVGIAIACLVLVLLSGVDRLLRLHLIEQSFSKMIKVNPTGAPFWIAVHLRRVKWVGLLIGVALIVPNLFWAIRH